MKKLVILKDRAEYIIKELGDKCKYIDEGGFLVIEIDNNDSAILTSLFHAKEYDIAGWVRQGKSGNFLSLTIAEPFKKDSDLPKQTTYNKPKDTGDLPF